ncbi:MAG TPA: acyl-CoA dehydrogenase family protein [Acidimicrobiales bacterium]|nr:acyl-CoA dehydrogenase family protein [Acidimicrobiales bacterium]
MTAPMADRSDAVRAARSVATTTLSPRAEETDRAYRVPRDNLDALADAGLFGLAAPEPDGAALPSPAVVREVHEALAGACGATFFVWAQHHTPVRLLARTSNVGLRERWLGRLCSGSALGGVMFAYLRWDQVPLRARRVPGGYRVSGVAPWATSWGMADVFAVAACLHDDLVLWFLRDGRADDAVRPSAPLELVVMQSTSTVRVAFEDLFVPEGDVLLVEPFEAWRHRDRITTSQPSPAALGVADTSLRLLGERAEATPDRTARDTARSLTTEIARSRHMAYRLADMPVPTEPGDSLETHLARMVEARVSNLDVARTASHALVTAVGGAAMARTHPAQRLAREAMFYFVQAQTAPIEEASLRRLTRDRDA